MQSDEDSTRQPRLSPIVCLFITVGIMGIASAIFETTLNNYLHDTFGLTADERGRLEFPRELPGFLTAIFAGALLFLPEARMAVVAIAITAVGLFGLAQVDISYWHMLVWLFLWSAGAHLFMPLRTALTFQLAEEGKSGTRLGQVGVVQTLGTLVGSLLVWQVLGRFATMYRIGFICAGVAAAAAGLMLLKMPHARHEPKSRTRFVFKARYKLFYILCVLFGARKQVFITFAPWVLVKVFEQPAQIIAKLWFVSGILGLAFKPILGRLIDTVGERAILMVDGLVLMGVCLGYGYAGSLLPESAVIYALYACFVIDHLMFAAGMARHTYVSKIAEGTGDMTPTLSLGVSIDHAVSMIVPCLGGLLWMKCGYPAVFLVAACVALMTVAVSSLIRVPRDGEPEEA